MNLDQAKRMNMASGGGLIGVVAMAAYNAMADKSKDVYLYPPAMVVLTSEDAAKNKDSFRRSTSLSGL